ncbi:MAG TPA: LapA family protein [candidate division Zixibacteria bacterium]|mgnify:CR=1 FL=1|nr:LapA family protein [candidate division Zixibacteria bacterium]
MWVVHLLLALLLVFSLVMFASLNGGRTVDFISLGFADFVNVPLNIIVIQSALFGALWALIVFLFVQISSRLKIMRLKKLNSQLREELDTLRILPLEDLPEEEG